MTEVWSWKKPNYSWHSEYPIARGEFPYVKGIETKILSDSGGHSNCDCGDDYCRCYRIHEAQVTFVDPGKVFAHVLDHLQPPQGHEVGPSDLWFLDRVLALHKAYKPEGFTVQGENDYYGDVLGPPTLVNHRTVYETLLTLLGQGTRDQVGWVLTQEYGYVLPRLEEVQDWTTREVQVSDITFPDSYHHKLHQETVRLYQNTTFPDGLPVCLVDSNLLLVDGRHRLTAAKLQGRKSVTVMVP